MGRHTGENGKVKIGAAFVAGLRSFDVTETADTVDMTAAGDTARDHESTFTSWSGSVEILLDHADAAQAVRAGVVVEFEGYTEGDASGATYLSGSAIVTEAAVSHSYDSEVTRSLSLQGKGALDVATVTP